MRKAPENSNGLEELETDDGVKKARALGLIRESVRRLYLSIRDEVIESLTEQVDQSVRFAIQRETRKAGMLQSGVVWMIALWLIPVRVTESYTGPMQQLCSRSFIVGLNHVVWYS